MSFSNIKCKSHITEKNVIVDLATPNTSSGYIYYTPIQLQTAYGMNLITPSDGHLKGYGIKIAVIIAFHSPSLQNDLNTYCTHFSLPSTTLNIISLGNTVNSDWNLECCLDVQMIHLMAPGAQIFVVEAASNSLNDLQTAIIRAQTLGVNVISMSFGSSEFSYETVFDSVFNTNNICYLASSGDTAGGVNYPSSSQNILSIGGSILTLTSSNQRLNETQWRQAGTGFSKFFSKPIYQNHVNTTSLKRCTPDVSLTADPAKGVIVYYNGNYYSVGGTSCSCPLMGGIIAVSDHLRKIANKPMLVSQSSNNKCIQNYLYNTIYPISSSYNNCIFDMTIGTDGSYRCTQGYDVCSGLGSIKANNLCNALLNL